LSKQYGWTPQQIGDMTLAQIFIYYWSAPPPRQDLEIDPSKVESLRAKIKYQRQWWLSAAQRVLGLE